MGLLDWLFKKKEEKKILLTPSTEEIKEVLEEISFLECPDVQRATGSCICISCPRKKKCYVEHLIRTSGRCGEPTNWFMTSCTVLDQEKGVFDAKEESGGETRYRRPRCLPDSDEILKG